MDTCSIYILLSKQVSEGQDMHVRETITINYAN